MRKLLADKLLADKFLAEGPENAKAVFVFAHGAGAPMDSPFMSAIARDLAAAGIRVVRFEFPYMAARRETGAKKPPNPMPVLLDCWRDVIVTTRQGLKDAALFIGGKSMGGRVASMIADEVGARGLVCFGYPFHPAGKPDRLRVDHLRDLCTPALILQGTRDTLGSREDVASYDLSAKIRVSWIETGNHDLSPLKSSGQTQADAWRFAADTAAEFIKAGS